MAQAEIILNRLCDLQGTNFEVTDVKVTEHQILWQIEHKENAVFICPRLGKRRTHLLETVNPAQDLNLAPSGRQV